MDVGVVVLVVMQERVQHGPWLLGGGGVIEVNQGRSVDRLIQNGKVAAQHFQRGRVRICVRGVYGGIGHENCEERGGAGLQKTGFEESWQGQKF